MATRADNHYHAPTTKHARGVFAFPSCKLVIVVLAWWYISGVSVGAQQIGTTGSPVSPVGSELTVWLVTIGPGEAVYEKFGHNAIVIEDRRRHTQKAYNYGIFDFEEHNFIPRFLMGRMNYQMDAWPAREMIEGYIAQDRFVCSQELNLTFAQRNDLRDFLEWNRQPANSAYLYDYYAQNCSTKVRDAVELALGGQLRGQLEGIRTERSYRWYTRRAVASSIPLYTALNFTLGHPTDRPLSAWQECFLPEKFCEYARRMTVLDQAGRPVPLVKAETVLHNSTRYRLGDGPPGWMLQYLAGGIVLGGVFVGLAWGSGRNRFVKFLFAVVVELWLIVVSIAGGFAAFAWIFSDHAAAYRNENLFHYSPLAILLLLFVPASIYGKRWARPIGQWIAIAVLVSSVIGLVAKVFPMLHQVNGELIALAIPAHGGLVGAMWVVGKRSVLVVRKRKG